jgi:hypothetical protein
MGLELSNGRVLQTFKLWIKLWGVLLKPFKYLIAPMLTFALLTWVYSGLYDKFGFERVIQSVVVIFIIISYRALNYLKTISENGKQEKKEIS